MTNKIDYHHAYLDEKIDQLQITNTTELCNHAKNIASQYENHMDNTQISIDDLRDDMHVTKNLQDMQCKLSKLE